MLEADKSSASHPEDVYYSKLYGLKEDSPRFAWDHGWIDSDPPFGLHKPWLGPQTKKNFKDWPDVNILRRLNVP